MEAFEKEIEKVKANLVLMADNISKMIREAIEGLEKREKKLLENVFLSEPQIDAMEIKNEKEIISLFARFQPEASDLRTLSMALFINRDLERIGDHSENIAESGIKYLEYPPVKPLIDIPRMAEISSDMLKDVIRAFIEKDSKLAVDVIKRDNDVDRLRDQIIMELTSFMVSDPKTIRPAVLLINITQHIERIADLATNLAEEAIYIIDGKVARHQDLRKL